MSISELIKRSFVYTKLYHPYRVKQENKRFSAKRELFLREGEIAFKAFVDCMINNNIEYWMEFGTLLGAYRDGDFVPNEIDIDLGVYLKDAMKIYYAMTKNGFRLVREFHVFGENGLEQTYEYHGITIDLMYFYEHDGKMWCNGSVITPKSPKNTLFTHAVTAHFYDRFTCTKMQFKGMEVSIPSNPEHHLAEIYGSGFRVYDPNFKGDLNKIFYPISDKHGFGWIVY